MAVQHTIRTKHGKTRTVKLTPVTAIKEHCKECLGFEPVVDGVDGIEGCLSTLCALWPFRKGIAHKR